MKIIHITDTHYGKVGEAIYKREPSYGLQEAIKSVNELHSDAEFCVITGDLVHFGQEGAYAYLKEDLSKLDIPYFLVVGNHDEREAFKRHFPQFLGDENGFVQYAFEAKNGAVFLVLDSIEAGTHAGFFCEKRQLWLKKQLEIYKDKEVYIHSRERLIGVP